MISLRKLKPFLKSKTKKIKFIDIKCPIPYTYVKEVQQSLSDELGHYKNFNQGGLDVGPHYFYKNNIQHFCIFCNINEQNNTTTEPNRSIRTLLSQLKEPRCRLLLLYITKNTPA